MLVANAAMRPDSAVQALATEVENMLARNSLPEQPDFCRQVLLYSELLLTHRALLRAVLMLQAGAHAGRSAGNSGLCPPPELHDLCAPGLRP